MGMDWTLVMVIRLRVRRRRVPAAAVMLLLLDFALILTFSGWVDF